MADAIAAGLVGCLAVIGVAGYYAARSWLRARRRWREASRRSWVQEYELYRAIGLVEAGRTGELTGEQRQLARGYYLHRYVAKGRDADKARLEALETLEEE